ncbi:hypothetical protein B1C78_12085 [Thioalkalivibrio denitrificans]|uniref:Sialidase domain-containing protein n=1 Tax=Thioalkalivibrio denitrificans TaxID=108003 RepID=A0A1V3NDS7_9GAMM|nr:hypothetical protein [Thioalkalivibrio denitrificans]OOG23210.1 hypothetical protein B1C78_12085 [Thioalkalivibrio denitrificans]
MRWLWLAAALALAPVQAQWQFGEPLWPAGEARSGIYHQLDGAARQHLAADRDHVALTWGDNRDGSYQVRVAYRHLSGDGGFGDVHTLSEGEEAYHPVVVALGDGRFLFAWEQDERVWMRVAGPEGAHPAIQADAAESTQPSLAAHPEHGVVAAWSRRENGALRVVSAPVAVDDAGVMQVGEAVPVDPEPAQRDQIYPTAAVTPSGVAVAWEDRREGHTRLHYVFRTHNGRFGPMQDLNDRRQGPRTQPYGAGSGVTRVALAAQGERIAAVWLDKRDYQSGYDVFAALSEDGGQSFGANEMVQDVFGAEIPQWHPGVAISPDGLPLAVWDDPRDDTPDVWMSWRETDEWSDDVEVAPAYGPGAHTRPAAVFGPDGRLHIAWTTRTEDGLSRLGYVVAQWR